MLLLVVVFFFFVLLCRAVVSDMLARDLGIQTSLSQGGVNMRKEVHRYFVGELIIEILWGW